MEYEKEQEYLRLRHSEGWKLIKVKFPGFYYFERCTPEDMIYQLDYSDKNRFKYSNRSEYIKMFEDCGWEHVLDFAQYNYFRKPVKAMNGSEEGIFCDDASRQEMMERIFRGRMVPVMILLCCCVLPGIFCQIIGAEPINYLYLTVLVLPFIIWIPIFTNYALKYREYRRNRK